MIQAITKPLCLGRLWGLTTAVTLNISPAFTEHPQLLSETRAIRIARLIGPTLAHLMGPMLAPWTLLSRNTFHPSLHALCYSYYIEMVSMASPISREKVQFSWESYLYRYECTYTSCIMTIYSTMYHNKEANACITIIPKCVLLWIASGSEVDVRWDGLQNVGPLFTGRRTSYRRSPEVSKPRDSGLDFSNRSDIW